MRALVYTVDHTLDVREIPEPVPAADEAVVRIEAVGICGSDVHGVASRSPRRSPPLVMGHELVGEVVGGGQDADHLLGQRVAVNPQVPCRDCASCRSGRENVCGERGLIGGTRAGGLAELVAVPVRSLHPLPPDLPWNDAVLAEPLATCVHALTLVPDRFLDTVVVLGGGSVGILAAALVRASGAGRVLVSEPHPARRAYAAGHVDAAVAPGELAEAVRTETGGRGATLTLDAVGLDSTRRASVEVLRTGGTAVWLGMEGHESTLAAFDLVVREQRVQGSFAYTNVEFAQAVGLLRRTDIARSVSRQVVGLEPGRSLLERLVCGEAPDTLKVVVAPGA